MSIIQILIEDHAFFRERFSQLGTLASLSEMSGTASLKIALINEFRKRHKVHLRRETELLIPALKEAYRKMNAKPMVPFLLLHLQEEHLSIGRNLYLLEQELLARTEGKDWVLILDKIVSSYIPHMDNEEKNLFPESQKFLSLKQLEKMAYVSVSGES